MPAEIARFADNLRQLPSNVKAKINQAIVKRNGLIVEYNGYMTALLDCNTCITYLGAETQSKGAMFYMADYCTKDLTEISKSLVLYNDAMRKIDRFPSVAEDTGTAPRTARHFLQSAINHMNGTVEISSAMAAAMLLGMPSEILSEEPINVYIGAAQKHLNMDREAEQLPVGDARMDEDVEDGEIGTDNDDASNVGENDTDTDDENAPQPLQV